ncbi:MAG: hypothetical protein FRX49_03185 [Trebouxia sp. A1-2]|nr:MAG: hypothetical protein FRX49_03185 [Trebouxia sp. A1-2]
MRGPLVAELSRQQSICKLDALPYFGVVFRCFNVFCAIPLGSLEQSHQATLHPFTESWKTVGYYIKFDDDITYIRRGTNEAVLHEKLQEPY